MGKSKRLNRDHAKKTQRPMVDNYTWSFFLVLSITFANSELAPSVDKSQATEPQITEIQATGGPNSELTELPETLDRTSFPPILMYHEIRINQIYNHFDVHVKDFALQLDWLVEAGYKTISLDELYEALRTGDQKFLEKSIVLTFDDGYLNNYSVVLPMLQNRNMKATFFIHTDAMENKNSLDYYPQVKWEQVYEIDRNPLFSVYSHSINHRNLLNLTDQELEKEIAQSKAIYEERLGGKRPFFSYPMGHYDARVIKMIRKHGYTMAFSVSERGFYAQPPQYSIPRIYMGTIMEDLNLFQYCVENYSAIDPNCFEERWKPLEKPN